jgi:carbamoyltransferase
LKKLQASCERQKAEIEPFGELEGVVAQWEDFDGRTEFYRLIPEQRLDWFEQDDDVPFMMQVFQIRREKRSLVPAICRVDGSGRLQTVHRETNPLYHQLISDFCSLTSVPMILNTSFNENEPVVCRPEEALDCFLRTKMDMLVMENFLAQRQSGDSD